MRTRWPLPMAVGLVIAFQAISSETSLSRLRSFGNPAFAASHPSAELIEGTDGQLYGTTPTGGSLGNGTVFRLSKSGEGFSILKDFGLMPEDGERPLSALIEGSDGLLYGAASEGGKFGCGSIYRIAKDGTQYTNLVNFNGQEGCYPSSRLLEKDQLLYGTTSGGGSSDCGVVFRVGMDGTGWTVLARFDGTNGANPEGGLIEGGDGAFYGTASSGAGTNQGTVFRLDPSTGFTVLKTFSSSAYGPYKPMGRVVQGTNEMLYGTTSAGGDYGGGTIFRLANDGSQFSILHHFTNTTGRVPVSELVLGQDGHLYGTAFDGGTNGSGVVYRIGHEGADYTVMAHLVAAQGPAASLLESQDANLYGTTLLGGNSDAGTVYSLSKTGFAFQILYHFSPSGGDGALPNSAVVKGRDGALYGTTAEGGAQGLGSIYKLGFNGRAYRLLSSLGTDARNPVAGLSAGADGWLYGASTFGGDSGNGSLLRIREDGSSFSVLYSIASASLGREPRGAAVRAHNGFLYGHTTMGGSFGQGAIFRLSTSGTDYQVLTNLVGFYSSSVNNPGANPVQPLLEASDGRLYGTTYFGGISNIGTIFCLDVAISRYLVLKSFTHRLSEGANPMCPLIEGQDGFLYGTTYTGGSSYEAGTVFRIAKTGTGFQKVHAFAGTTTGAARHPSGALAQSANGDLYGTTERGGADDCGTLFRIGTNGNNYAIVATFNGSFGKFPLGGVVVGPDGAIYGTTSQGGDLDLGTVFRYGQPIEMISDVTIELGKLRLTCQGITGTNYCIDRAFELTAMPNWETVWTTNTPSSGIFDFVDPEQGAAAFYRLRRL